MGQTGQSEAIHLPEGQQGLGIPLKKFIILASFCQIRDMRMNLAVSAELFHTSSGIAYADLLIDGHRETWPIRSSAFGPGCDVDITRRRAPPERGGDPAQPGRAVASCG
jgi:hypothetical protein